MSVDAPICILSSICMSFLTYGLHAYIQYSGWGIIITIALYRGSINLFSLYVRFLRIIPRTRLPSYAAILHCSDTFMLAFIVIPKYFLKASFDRCFLLGRFPCFPIGTYLPTALSSSLRKIFQHSVAVLFFILSFPSSCAKLCLISLPFLKSLLRAPRFTHTFATAYYCI